MRRGLRVFTASAVIVAVVVTSGNYVTSQQTPPPPVVPTQTIDAITVHEGMVSYYGNKVIPNGDDAEQWAAEMCMDTREEPGRHPEDCFVEAMGEVGWSYVDEGEGGWVWNYSDAETDKMLAALAEAGYTEWVPEEGA